MGFAVIEKNGPKLRLITAGCIETSGALPHEARLRQIYQKLSELIADKHPSALSIERLFFAANQKTAIPVAEARGVALLTAGINGIKVYEYAPPEVKRAVTGDGKADKKSVQKMVALTIGNNDKFIDDAADAIALAITAAYDIKNRSLVEES